MLENKKHSAFSRIHLILTMGSQEICAANLLSLHNLKLQSVKQKNASLEAAFDKNKTTDLWNTSVELTKIENEI